MSICENEENMERHTSLSHTERAFKAFMDTIGIGLNVKFKAPIRGVNDSVLTLTVIKNIWRKIGREKPLVPAISMFVYIRAASYTHSTLCSSPITGPVCP